MELEIINKLYLELSQVATARTQRELALEDAGNQLCAILAVMVVRLGCGCNKASGICPKCHKFSLDAEKAGREWINTVSSYSI